ncbi:hypothetical protein ACFCX0_03675 [Streptomyces sp. NPDC056352]|uniref:hypothetical protein n=1 Tax=Streptomyces sp. NPDC056352 TaxID=3345791 RepID=UPI0035D709A3
MTDTTPAAELRAAAEKLRSLAAEASPAPWTVNQWGNVETAGYEEVAEVWPLQSGPQVNAAYIAAMHPAVGLVLADWLDAAAKSYDALVIGAASVWRRSDEVEERDAWVAKQTDQYALAVARQINGTA